MGPTHYPPIKRTESPSILGLQAPALSRCLDLLIPIYNPPSVCPNRARTHDKRITSLPSPHPLVYARNKEICDLTRVQCNGRSLIDTGGTNATKASLRFPNQVHIQFQVQSHSVSNYYPYIIHVIVT
jgi:hypothetical protein